MKTPSEADLTTYDEMLSAVKTAKAAGEDTSAQEAELKAFMVKTGIANEAPVTDFPELSEPDDEGKP